MAQRHLEVCASALCVASILLPRRAKLAAAVCAGAALALALVNCLGLAADAGKTGDAPNKAGNAPVDADEAARLAAGEADKADKAAAAKDRGGVAGFPELPKCRAADAPASERAPEAKMTWLLVHNVSHSDLVVSFGAAAEVAGADDFDDEAVLLARPKFSSFLAVTRDLLDHVERGPGARVAYARKRRRDVSRPKYALSADSPLPRAAAQTRAPPPPQRHLAAVPERGPPKTPDRALAAGLRLDGSAAPWSAERIHDELKVKQNYFRNTGAAAAPPAPESPLWPRRVYFPLLAVILRAWLASIADDGGDADSPGASEERVLLLVTGVGTPRDEASGAGDNSTELAAELIELFVRRVFIASGKITRVVRLHSEANVFRYDENISFVRHELDPAIAALRREAVDAAAEDWASHFRVAVSFADGAPARVSTIHRALRRYRPTCLYAWQLKTFWESRVLSEDDVEALSFEATDTVPATPSALATGDAKLVVDEMRVLRDKWLRAARDPRGHDMASFWHRKSLKVVLAVLLVRVPGEEPKLYHGTNMEVSMPTGSLCAERNVIGSALADNLGLKRAHLCSIAVLGLQNAAPLPYTGCALATASGSPLNSTRGRPIAATSRAPKNRALSKPDLPPSTPATTPPTTPSRRQRTLSESDIAALKLHSPPGSPTLFGVTDVSSPKSRSQVVRSYPRIMSRLELGRSPAVMTPATRVHVECEDINPLRPCGACAEWLKKIARVNPDLTVVTFTDQDCHGHFVEPAMLC